VSEREIAQMFLTLASPSHFVQQLGFEPDSWQMDLMGSETPRIIIACGRQVGKSTVTGLKAYRKAKMSPGSLTLLISNSYRQSLLLFSKIEDAVRADPDKTLIEKMNLQELRLTNGSRIIAAPGKGETVRGFSGVDLLVIDEAAYVPDALYSAVSPMVAASGGQVILLSSPAGKTGFFWNIWDKGKDWERYKVRADECPRIPQTFLDDEKATIPDHVYRREYEAEFTEGLNSLVSYEDLKASMENDVKSIGDWSLDPADNRDRLPKVEALSG